MPGLQIGAYSEAELRLEIEHLGLVLTEVQNFSYDMDPTVEAAGAGLGFLKNTYWKQTAPPKGTAKFSRHMLTRGDAGGGAVFEDLASGSRLIIQEPIATAATTYTVGQATTMVSILEIRLNTSLQVLREFVDYTVNYVTGTVTFAITTPEAATIRYLSSARKGQQFILNGGFEDALGSTWIVVAGATIARNFLAANVYTESAALAVTPVTAADGVQYNISTTLVPGRTYRLQIRAKAAAAETLQPKWNDGTTDQAMTPATGAGLTASYTLQEFTFTSTKAVVPNIKILDSKASPGLFYIDEVKLIDDSATLSGSPTYATNPMDAGMTAPFTFNILARRIADGVVIARFQKCIVQKDAWKSSKMYDEDIDIEFLDFVGE